MRSPSSVPSEEPDAEAASVHALKENAWREVAAIDAALEAGEIDETGWHTAIAGLVRPAYLAAGTPWGQSGMTRGEADWVSARRFVLAAVERNGTFLDCGCANGYLMECLERWAAAGGLRLELYGLDIIGELVALARRRLPHCAGRIWEGNALTWVPPRRFDVVRVGLEYVPERRRPDLVRHLLTTVVAPGGRLVIGPYTEETGTPETERALVRWGYAVSGRAEVAHRDPRVVRRIVWLDGAEHSASVLQP
ncbi:class I SAM-dependent methyltransferase [Streptomyces inhibens]|uniref:class I SAM-dependent methyltransferase n=1 Tax=Streptomyces inhibens TaxID=2293571 RepID=UPI0037A256B4